jgi:hypothetical protein
LADPIGIGARQPQGGSGSWEQPGVPGA